MKHPSHGIRVCIVTSDYACPEFETERKNEMMRCFIPSFTMASWSYTWRADLLTDYKNPRPIYKIEGYEGGILISGPTYIDRRKKDELEGSTPNLSRREEDVVGGDYKWLDTRHEAEPSGPDQLIEVRIYECQEKPFSSSPNQHFPGNFPVKNPFEEFEGEAEKIIVRYRFTFELPEKLRSNLIGRVTALSQDQKPHEDDLPLYLGSRKQPSSLVNIESETLPNKKSKSHYYKYIKRASGFREGRSPLGIRAADLSGVWKWERKPVAEQARSPRRTVGVDLYRKLDSQFVYDTRTDLDPDLTWLGRLKAYYPVTAGWEVKFTSKGNLYYVNHRKKSTSWQHPLIKNVETYRRILQTSETGPAPGNLTLTAEESGSGENEGVENGSEKKLDDDIYEGDITQQYMEMHQEQRDVEWDTSSLLNSDQVKYSMLRDLRDRTDLIQARRVEVEGKYAVYCESYWELFSWIEKYSQLWFPTSTNSTSLSHEKQAYLINRSILLNCALKEATSLEVQLTGAEEEETNLLYELSEGDPGLFGEERERIDKKRGLDELMGMEEEAAHVLDEFASPKAGDIYTYTDPDLHRDKILKINKVIPRYTNLEDQAGEASAPDSGYNFLSKNEPEVLLEGDYRLAPEESTVLVSIPHQPLDGTRIEVSSPTSGTVGEPEVTNI